MTDLRETLAAVLERHRRDNPPDDGDCFTCAAEHHGEAVVVDFPCDAYLSASAALVLLEAAQRVVDRCEISGGWKAMQALEEALARAAQEMTPEGRALSENGAPEPAPSDLCGKCEVKREDHDSEGEQDENGEQAHAFEEKGAPE